MLWINNNDDDDVMSVYITLFKLSKRTCVMAEIIVNFPPVQEAGTRTQEKTKISNVAFQNTHPPHMENCLSTHFPQTKQSLVNIY